MFKIVLRNIDFESRGWPGTARDPQSFVFFIRILSKVINLESQGWPGTAEDPKNFDFKFKYLKQTSILRAGAGQGQPGSHKAWILIKILLKNINFESRGWPRTAGDPENFDFQLNPFEKYQI